MIPTRTRLPMCCTIMATNASRAASPAPWRAFGEHLGEHGLFSHRNGLFQEVLEVPFILMRFGHAGRTIVPPQSPRAAIDIPATLADDLGIVAPRSWRGVSLLRDQQRDFIHVRHDADIGLIDVRDKFAVWKYWVHRRDKTEKVYNLTSDPRESRNASTEIQADLRAEWVRALEPSWNAVGDLDAIELLAR